MLVLIFQNIRNSNKKELQQNNFNFVKGIPSMRKSQKADTVDEGVSEIIEKHEKVDIKMSEIM